MPKSVLGLPQGGALRERAQFEFEEEGGELWFDEIREWKGEEVDVEGARPQDEAMSDHLLVVGIVSLSSS